ncbi:hypothetical protein [Exiguobacterium artemiae]|uniref:hypothetical protein n=1 Tax=Exiguobacterium artemiae TaxID=340145 RepID=UPI0029654BFD|nr:hypothetical protein [Exiguobacterium sibiricum]MDW2884625.1 hypothetical protein [Exiguobacterium sibiricum]
MIFASDLDRTLIYSKSSAEDHLNDSTLVEYYDKKSNSYMKNSVIKDLMDFSEKNLFIPVTTRTMEQYERISFFQEKLKPRFAIVANGAVLLVDGKRSQEWDEIILAEHHNYKEKKKELIQFILFNIEKKCIIKLKEAEEYFLYLILNIEHIDDKKITKVSKWAESQEWIVSQQGRKIYFIPRYINKRAPLQYLREKQNIVGEIFASGDSILDYPLVKYADFSMVPLHGEIICYDSTLNKTSERGIKSSLEIMKKVNEYSKKLN